MKKIILASALTALLIGCNKDKKAESTPASSAAEAKASVFTVISEIDFGGGDILKTCQSYAGADTAAYRKVTTKKNEVPAGQMGHVTQVFGNTPCSKENAAAFCSNADVDSLKGAKEDLYLYKLKSPEGTKEMAEMLKKDCIKKFNGTFTNL